MCEQHDDDSYIALHKQANNDKICEMSFSAFLYDSSFELIFFKVETYRYERRTVDEIKSNYKRIRQNYL